MIIAGETREIIAENAESIIATFIEEANNGEIDLTGFNAFWTFTKKQVMASFRVFEEDLNYVSPACNKSSKGLLCSKCVCGYMNHISDEAIANINNILNLATAQSLELFGVDLEPYIKEFMETDISSWKIDHSCSGFQGKGD